MSADTQTKLTPAEEKILQLNKASKKASDQAVSEGVETLKQTSDSLQQMSGQGMAVISDSIAAAVESGSVMTKLMTDMSKNYMETCSANMSNLTEFSRQAMTCRTPADMVELQKKAMETMTARLTASTKVYSDLFTNASKAWEPMMARASKAPSRLFGVLAD